MSEESGNVELFCDVDKRFKYFKPVVKQALIIAMNFSLFTFDVTVHGGPVNSLSFHPSGNYLVSASADNTLKVRFERSV